MQRMPDTQMKVDGYVPTETTEVCMDQMYVLLKLRSLVYLLK